MGRPIIEVESLSKHYNLGAIGATSLRDAFAHWWENRKRRSPQGRPGGFWALRDVTFSVQPGEIVGIIGRNGAGKSTLLKIMSRITEPTSGRAILRGRVASLLEVGTGFHPDLTGRENVFLNGAILGMTRADIIKKFDEIVAFAEVDQFIDTPVKRYSSGMYVRLAFAVAAHLEPQILIIDEVLAVGDVQFQQKCLGKIRSVATGEGRTVLFVSHNMQAVATLCSRAFLLENGRVARTGNPSDIVVDYLRDGANSDKGYDWSGTAGDDRIRISHARLLSSHQGNFQTHEPLTIEVEGEVLKPILGLVMAIEVWSSRNQMLAYTAQDDALMPPAVEVPVGRFARRLTIPPDTFASGAYEFRLDVGIHNVKRITGPTEICLHATFENLHGIGRRLQSNWTHVFRPAWRWDPM